MMKVNNVSRSISMAALAVGLGLSAVACGSSGGSDGTPATTSPASDASTTAASGASGSSSDATTAPGASTTGTIVGSADDLDKCASDDAATTATTFVSSIVYAEASTFGQCLAEGVSFDLSVAEEVANGDFDTTTPVAASEPDSFDFKQTSGSQAFHVTLEQGAGGKYYVTAAVIA